MTGRTAFRQMALPHLDAAYNLALWLTRNADDAEDVVQEALLRAMRYMGAFDVESARPWLLQVVRHTCYTWLKENRPADRSSWTTRRTWRDSRPRRATSPLRSRSVRRTGSGSTMRSPRCLCLTARCRAPGD